MADTNFDPNKVISGTFGTLYFNLDGTDKELANVKKFNVKMKPAFTEFDNCNILGKCSKFCGYEIEGEFTLNRLNYNISKEFCKSWNSRKNPVLRLVAESNDPDAEGNTRVVLTGVTLEEVALLDFEAKTLAEETYSFKAVKAEYTD